jgi:hypothetical protein
VLDIRVSGGEIGSWALQGLPHEHPERQHMSKKKWSGKCFVLYDGRARSGDTDRAIVLVSASSEREARVDSSGFRGQGAIWYEYDVVDGVATNEKQRPDIKV